MNPNLLQNYTWIIVNSSGGKDSQTALRETVIRCHHLNIPLDRVVVSHQCLGAMEWTGTAALARQQAEAYGLRFEISKYQDKDGKELTLLDYVRLRKMWPSSTNRWCTSDFKRGPGGRVITKLWRERQGPVLNVYGFRASESTRRAKKATMARNNRFSTKSREVYDWLPIHHFSDEMVWDSIKASGVPYHHAYDLGMPRLSCVLHLRAASGTHHCRQGQS